MGAGKGKSRRARFVDARTLQTIPDTTFKDVLDEIWATEEPYNSAYLRVYNEEYAPFEKAHSMKIFIANRMHKTCAPQGTWERMGRVVKPGENPIDYKYWKGSRRTTGPNGPVFDISQTVRDHVGVSEAEWDRRDGVAKHCADFLEEKIREVGLRLIEVPSDKKYKYVRK